MFVSKCGITEHVSCDVWMFQICACSSGAEVAGRAKFEAAFCCSRRFSEMGVDEVRCQEGNVVEKT